ncbi:uncharacterized protein [Diadema antillarum]|uniref:uncharacterized protein n=1 Tax=Diadema antillarum TaxID=105358 RepID=UPI003A8BD848
MNSYPTTQKTPTRDRKQVSKNVTIAPDSIAIIFSPVPPKPSAGGETDASSNTAHHRHTARNGKELFKELQRENKHSVWNKPLADSIRGISYLGSFEPWTIFVKGTEQQLDCLRSAYARRVLKPPRNFMISNLGDVPSVELWPIQQAQFIPLTEVLCLLISEMNRRKLVATQDTVRKKLSECYDKMPVPSPEIIHKSLTHLMNEGKILHNGLGYYITKGDEVPPDTTDAESVATFATAKKKEKVKPAKEYLMYKDGVLTRHTFPEKVNENMGIKVRAESSASSRPLSYPANPALDSIPEGRAAFQRSMSMREKRSPQKRSNFERTSSMRLPSDISYYDQGYLTSDSEAKPSCLGRLLGKAVQKKPKQMQNNYAAPLQTFSAQFPPSDIHDPFFNYNHWMKKTPEKLGNKTQKDDDKNREEREKSKTLEAAPSMPKHTVSPKTKRKSLPADMNNVKASHHYALDHGRLTQTAKALQQKYQDGQESMPESEVEFLRPTKMYDGKHRTKAVAEQKPLLSKSPQKAAKDDKGDKIKHYFNSMDRSQPHNPKPYQGLTSESSLAGSDSELEMNPRRRVAAVEKRLLKQRHADLLRERRQGRLFASQRVEPNGSTANVSSQRQAEEDSRVRPYERSAVEQYEKRRSHSVRRCSSEEDLSDAQMVQPPEHERQLVATSRKICLAFQDNGKMVVKSAPHHSSLHSSNNQMSESLENNRLQPESDRTGDSTQLEKVVMRKHDLLQKRPHSSHETFYKDEEIDKLLEEEMQNEKADQKLKVHSKREENDKNRSSGMQSYPEILEHYNRGGNGELNRSFDRESFISMSTTEYTDHGDPPSIVSHPISPSGAINGSCPSLPQGQPPAHQRMESLSSSTGDSGFNSPRSSVNNGFNSNGFPSKQISPDSLTIKSHSSSSSSIPVLVRPIPRRGYNSTAMAKVSPTDPQRRRPLSSTSDQSSSSDLTVKSLKERRRSESDDKDGNSTSSEKSGHSSRSKRLSRVKSYEVIGTV